MGSEIINELDNFSTLFSHVTVEGFKSFIPKSVVIHDFIFFLYYTGKDLTF
jgi:hypothetical protein